MSRLTHSVLSATVPTTDGKRRQTFWVHCSHSGLTVVHRKGLPQAILPGSLVVEGGQQVLTQRAVDSGGDAGLTENL
jgi:hypothetical protein